MIDRNNFTFLLVMAFGGLLAACDGAETSAEANGNAAATALGDVGVRASSDDNVGGEAAKGCQTVMAMDLGITARRARTVTIAGVQRIQSSLSSVAMASITIVTAVSKRAADATRASRYRVTQVLRGPRISAVAEPAFKSVEMVFWDPARHRVFLSKRFVTAQMMTVMARLMKSY